MILKIFFSLFIFSLTIFFFYNNKILIGLISALFFILFMYKNFLYPILHIKKTIKKFSEILGFKIKLYKWHEIENFLNQLIQLKNSLQYKIDEANTIQKKIINLSDEFIAIIENTGKILELNDKFLKYINSNWKTFDDFRGKFFWEIFRNYKLNLLISEAIKKLKINDYLKDEINLDYNFFLVFINKLNNKIFLLKLKDVSLEKQVNTYQQEFIDNLLHEVKTPLTNIKGYIETIENNILNEYPEINIELLLNYLKVVNNNAERINKLLDKLLKLSKIEKEKFYEIEKINFSTFLNDFLKLYERQIKEKKLNIIISISKDLEELYYDKFLLEQIVYNLIDNAIKYTDKGYIRIELEKIDNQNFRIIIEDSGIGIDKEHLNRIFDRFYIVDKSRSKKFGSFGLGLSIVRSSVHSCNGSIYVKSEISKGTKFEIILPLNLLN